MADINGLFASSCMTTARCETARRSLFALAAKRWDRSSSLLILWPPASRAACNIRPLGARLAPNPSPLTCLSAVPRLAARHAVVQRIARRQTPRHLAHDVHDLSHDITAVTTVDAFQQVTDRRADLRFGIVSAVEMKLIRHDVANPAWRGPDSPSASTTPSTI